MTTAIAIAEGLPRESAPLRDTPVTLGRPVRSALPPDWEEMWSAKPGQRRALDRFRALAEDLSEGIPRIDFTDTFGPLVGSEELRAAPVHRWFTYKEGYSPSLLKAVLLNLPLDGSDLRVADVFGGVATTAISGMQLDQVAEVRSLEYSPWAHFAGKTKLSWATLDPARLRNFAPAAADFVVDPSLPFPELSSFSNPSIFDRATVQELVSARDHVRHLRDLSPAERDFFLLGLGAAIEDLSKAMKDGRALRIQRGRKRRPSSLAKGLDVVPSGVRVRTALTSQWSEMISDLERLAPVRDAALATPVEHVRGDARALDRARFDSTDTPVFPESWADVSCFSPPYLNCIDYTELYKLELWLLEHVASQQEFRDTRLGTLRSHPSVKFPPRDSFADVKDSSIVQFVEELSSWLTEHSSRRDVGPVVQNYFEDMFVVWKEQHKLVRPGGAAVCVVANSTFSRRTTEAGSRTEQWRVPLLTDVMLARLAELAGFSRTEVWDARTLRPRNVKRGSARESLVVAYR